MRPTTAVLALVVTALVSWGCAPRRTLKVRSVPPGAVVRVDDETVGVTPLDLRFYYYGRRRITLQKEGYRTHSEEIELDSVWWSRFPIDFVSEVLLPFGWKDNRRYKVELAKGAEVLTIPSLHSVIERADVLRNAGSDGPRDLPPPVTVEVPAANEVDDDEPR